ncbi:proline racemase family protein [Starkeya sp. ORNL1]|uniref:proline racemase family protein n=1 Tax=Starkeya sp. ORNL1 TaxID=2709380 RepID=UPI001463EA3C|nr:proline racemase family protein [Starkeya sp. ORNL1]QJP16873.1 proline racemase family protein [Starkeya sp. ORNL1]
MLNLASSFDVIDSHTAGHPTRVILSGVPKLDGASVLEKREDFRARFDYLRPLLLHEPRGHAAMVGLVPVASTVADYGAFFISSYVYLDMCGHGTIGYARTLAATGQIAPQLGDSFTLETPAGVVTVGLVWGANGDLAGVRLRNVPSYVGIADLAVDFEGFGTVKADIVYGGMWYALVDATAMGLELVPERVSELLRIGSALKQAIKAAIAGRPEFAGAVAPSVLFYADGAPGEAVHFLVLESNKFDRSPCGTGTAARVAQLAVRGRLGADGTYRARNILGVDFLARVAERTPEGAIVAEIEGMAHLTAHSTIVLETSDPIAQGFLCR